MNIRKFILALFVITSTVVYSASAQRDTVALQSIIAKTGKYISERPFEKVYLHFDKPYYAVGDTIWFKAYVTMMQHQPSSLSKIVYVEMLSSTDSIVQSLKLQVSNGIATGDIPLSQLFIKKGNYHIRAYTQWMRNFDTDYFFNKTITVGNAIDNELITNAWFAGSEKNDITKINARIVYKDETGLPYANKKVTWKIETDNDKPLKGKGTTDNNGVLNLNIEGNKALALTTRSLVTVLERGGTKKAIGSTYALKYANPAVDVQFFPEGGELIGGLRTRMAFKAIKANGLGIDVKGTITDNDGKTVAEIASQNLGMGVFFMVAEYGKSYKANMVMPDGATHVYDLPRVQQSGIALSVNNTDPDNLGIKISANDLYFQEHQNQRFYIIAQTQGFIYYAAQSMLLSQVYSGSIPKSKFPTGIIQFTLFTDKGDPLSERIVFVKGNDLLNLSAGTTKQVFGTREKVKLNIATNANGQPAQSSLSVAVIDETKVPYDENAETTILTSLLLTSDLKGYVEKPNTYFNHVTPETIANLDVLMLTQGYRRFSYRDIIRDKYPPLYFLPEQGIDISGTLRNQTGMPINKGSIKLTIPDRNYTAQAITDANGVFKFQKLLLLDSSKVILNARNNVNNNNLMIMLDYPRLQGFTRNIDEPSAILNIDSALQTYLNNSQKQYKYTHTLKEVEIKSAPVVHKISHADYPALTGLNMMADHELSGDMVKDCADLGTCIQGMLMGLTFNDQNFYITRDYNQGKRVPVQIYVGGFPVDYSYLSSITPSQVESIEIFMDDGLSGINRMTNTSGVLVINTRKAPEGKKITIDELKQLFPPKYILSFSPQGYNMGRVFYSPKYNVPHPAVVGANDLRTTIYWNPMVNTDKTGNASVEFYNADGKGTYKAVIEGIDADGNIGRYVYRYKVQ